MRRAIFRIDAEGRRSGRRVGTNPPARDLKRFIAAAFGALRTVVGCDFVSLLYRRAGNGLLRELDSRGRTYSQAFMRRYAELTPAIPLVLQNRGVKVLATRNGLTLPEAELRKTPFYREVMTPQQWRHAVALCFWGQPQSPFPVLVVTVNRREGRPDFSEREIRRLCDIHPILDGWVADLLEHTGARLAYTGVAAVVHHERRGVLVLDSRLRVTLANSAARRLCAAWAQARPAPDATAECRRRVPPALMAACRDLYDDWHRALRGNGSARRASRHREVVHPGIPALSARASINCPDADSLAEPSFVIELRLHNHEPAPDRRPVDALAGLTPAEREVAAALGVGLSNQEIADRLGKTVHAVKFLLHRAYQRTGIANRTQLASAVQHGAQEPT